MVVFTCNNCGDSLQKPKVAKHFQFQCRNPIALTCVDCLKDFLNDEYIAHTKCITEAERYGGKNFVPKPSANKGEKKQQEWINIVNSVLTSSQILTNEERSFLQSIAKYQNIPRKKAKYLNFIKNALGYRVNYNIVESCWEKMESAYKEITDSYKKNNNNNQNNSNSVNADNDNHSKNNNCSNNVSRETEEKKKNSKSKEVIEVEKEDDEEMKKKSSKKKKRKNLEQEEINTNKNSNEVDEIEKKPKNKKKKLNNSEAISENGNFKENHLSNGVQIENVEENKDNGESSEKSHKFDWKSEILEIFESKQEISLKKLKKKVLQKYLSVYPDVSYDKIESRFNKKLNKISQLVISDDRVKLTS
ncbi:uncharacterized protein C16C10.8 [Chelonus insularis]|uniref:uncharacterized protein C16C10.8 n=1 Tax=Chelonus insularis TaxID=460826 RepID=UPI00158F204B|nr:uncharacterized protein C16C10.8 [Chelonus insularis]